MKIRVSQTLAARESGLVRRAAPALILLGLAVACGNDRLRAAGEQVEAVSGNPGVGQGLPGVDRADGGPDAGAFGPAACKSHVCLKKDSGNVCTATCKVSTDCPGTWSCTDVAQVGGGTISVCVPPGVGP